jgi:orotidine-5'-phosphate decarboxylase
MSIVAKYEARVESADSLVCVGLDSDIRTLPERFLQMDCPQFEFNRYIIDQTHAFTAAYKPNLAFYEMRGEAGWHDLKLTLDYLRREHPEIVIVGDAKRGDVESTSEAYASAMLDELGFDAVTLSPYLGRAALEPFLSRADKGCIILCRTSNPGAGEIQDLMIGDKPLWLVIAEKVSREWNSNQNCMLVVGATYPDEMRQIRALVGDLTLLIPGVGAQGGGIQQTVTAGRNHHGRGMMINASRSIIFADNPGAAARELRDTINLYRF